MAKCYINNKDWKKILNYAQASYDKWKAEIGGMAVCYKDKEDDWILTEPVILKQEVDHGSTSIDKTELAKYYTKTGMKWGKKEFRFCWWHSHHNMGAFWSKTDTDTIDEYEDSDLSFALVVCLNGDYKFRVSMWEPFVSHQDVKLNIIGSEKSTVPKKIVNEVEALCEKPVSKWQTTRGVNQYNGYYRQTYGSSDQQTALFGVDEPNTYINKQEADFLIGKQGEFQDKLIDGELTHNRYVEMVKNMNADLEKRGSIFRLQPFPNPIDDEVIYSAIPDAYVFEVGKDGKPIVDPEIDEWNQSFGVY